VHHSTIVKLEDDTNPFWLVDMVILDHITFVASFDNHKYGKLDVVVLQAFGRMSCNIKPVEILCGVFCRVDFATNLLAMWICALEHEFFLTLRNMFDGVVRAFQCGHL